MKIAKKIVQASEEVTTSGKYDECIGHIKDAIQSLANIAKDDDIAKDAIANLSVILFDLKG